jgi:G:T-mismatch repair DNA endonuclease (very short patch repair protein)
MVDGNLIVEYFDIKKFSEKGVTKIKLSLKESKKIRNDIPRRFDNMPFSGATVEYYQHYLGKDTGSLVYSERRKLFAKISLINWYISYFNPDDSDQLLQEISNLKGKISKAIIDFYDSPTGELAKEKLKVKTAYWAPILAKRNSERWKDKDWASEQMQKRKDSGFYANNVEKSKIRHANPEFRQKMLIANRSPERIAKISKAAKNMWAQAKLNDPDKVRRMMISSRNKNYSFNGIGMNSVEYIMAKLLEEIGEEFVYEKVVTFGKISYIPDFYLPTSNTIIECYGDYWHANPAKFSPLDSVFRIPVGEIWDRDRNRERLFLENGYQYLSFWEHNIVNSLSTVKKQLCNILKKN